MIVQLEIENIKQKQLEEKKEIERLNNIEKKKEEDIKKKLEVERIANQKKEEIKEVINTQKDFWNNIRNNRVANTNTNVNKMYGIGNDVVTFTAATYTIELFQSTTTTPGPIDISDKTVNFSITFTQL